MRTPDSNPQQPPPIPAIRLLGAFSVDVDGEPIRKFTTAKARALLAYLALNPDQPVSRSVLATLFWPDTGDQNARDNLRNTLHRLRNTLASGVAEPAKVLTATRQAVELHGTAIQIDVVEFQQALNAVANHAHPSLAECPECLTVLKDATALYRGEFLTGLDIPDAEPFEEWLQLRREFFAHRVRHTLSGLVTAYEIRGEWLTKADHRAVAILGLGGMGETTLAAHAARRLTDHFDAVIWRSLINAPTLEELLRPLLQHVQRTQGYAHLPAGVDEQLAHFFSYLQANRVLLVLDNMETILDETNAGRFRAGYESYGQLIRQMIQRPHQSRLLFTSRERPNEFHRLEMDQATVHSLRLDGLDEAAASRILRQRGIHAAQNDEAALRQRYSGNPLALKLVADTVKEIFEEDIGILLTEETLVFDDVRKVLDQQFERLSPLEEDILLWLTVARTPLSAQALRSRLLQAPSQRALLEAIGALQRRSLIERRAHGFHLQNVVADYLASFLIDQVCAEIERGEPVRLHSHGLINAHADDGVRQSQVRLLLGPMAELTAARLGPATFIQQLRAMLAALQMTAQRNPSYAGGNLLNLLLHQSAPHRWTRRIEDRDPAHVYLRGVKLPNIDFRDADLEHSVFNDTFGAVYSIAISPDGQFFAGGTADGEVRLWRMSDGQPLSIITGHHDSIWSIAFSPDGKTLVSASADKTARIWDMETLAPLHILRGHTAALQTVAFHPDRTIRLWDVETVESYFVLLGHANWVLSLAFTQEGEMLISGSEDQTARAWNPATGEQRNSPRDTRIGCTALT